MMYLAPQPVLSARPGVMLGPAPYGAGLGLGAGTPRRRRARIALGQSPLDILFGGGGGTAPTVAPGVDPSIEQIYGNVTGTKGFDATGKSFFDQAVQARQLPTYSTSRGPCTSSGGSVKVGALGPAIEKTAGTTAIEFSWAAGPAAPFVLAAGVILDVFGTFGAHHAKAVAREQGTLCVAVPAANDALSQIQQAIAAGQLSSAQASTALDQVVTAYYQYVNAIIKDNTATNRTKCNEACGYGRALRGIVAQLKIDMKNNPPPADQSAAVAAPGAAAAGAATAGIPTWAVASIGFVILYSLLGG